MKQGKSTKKQALKVEIGVKDSGYLPYNLNFGAYFTGGDKKTSFFLKFPRTSCYKITAKVCAKADSQCQFAVCVSEQKTITNSFSR